MEPGISVWSENFWKKKWNFSKRNQIYIQTWNFFNRKIRKRKIFLFLREIPVSNQNSFFASHIFRPTHLIFFGRSNQKFAQNISKKKIFSIRKNPKFSKIKYEKKVKWKWCKNRSKRVGSGHTHDYYIYMFWDFS